MLSGWAGCGKDAAAALLVEEMQFDKLAFATELKQDVSEATGLPLELFHSHTKKDEILDSGQTPRSLLLAHALKARAKDPDIYCRMVKDKILERRMNRVVISDWRYKQEYEFLDKELGNQYLILGGRIIRSGLKASADPSEHDLDKGVFEFTIHNDGSISDLRDKLRSLVHRSTDNFVHSGS